MEKILLTNTLKGKKKEFEPITKGKVSMYSCGPTVYDYAHIGNFRTFLMSDILFRVLEYAGYEVKKVQNITDVGHLTNDDLADADGEDKIAKKAIAEEKDPFEIARYYEDCFVEDEKILRIIPPNGGRPRATDYISEQIAIAKKLIEKQFAYEVNGSVYFRTAKFKDYGKLSGNKIKDLQAGARVEINSEKEDPLDFALWKKANEDHLMQWDSPWGRGFPGWHIECSAMSQKLLGENFDIHTGGEDNIFPHHECEIAQNECSHGGKINYWLHAKHLLVDGKKMSKSKGNFYTIRDLLDKGWKGNEIRLALLKSHYRSALNFSESSLIEARANIKKISEVYRKCKELIEKGTQASEGYVWKKTIDYKKMLFDDLNVPSALSYMYEMIDMAMEAGITEANAGQLIYFLEEDFNPIFDIFPEEKEISAELTQKIEQKISERTKARANEDWTLSDNIRDELAAEGIELIDEAGKTSWRIK